MYRLGRSYLSGHVDGRSRERIVLGGGIIGKEEFGRVEDVGVDGKAEQKKGVQALRALRAADSREENSISDASK
jgi:hypothetical protein